MSKFDIVMIGGLVETIEADSPMEALEVFAFSFDMDLTRYFKAVPADDKNDDCVNI